MKKLIDLGCDLEVKDSAMRTPLSVAVYYNRMSITTLLVEAGCQLNVRDSGGKTPLLLATKNHNLEVSQYLLESK